MTVKNSTLYRMFEQGSGEGMNHTETMEILSIGSEQLLVGYSHCIYAHRASDSEITKYTGWVDSDTSNTTNRQIEAIDADRCINARPQIVNWNTGTIQPDGAKRIQNLKRFAQHTDQA